MPKAGTAVGWEKLGSARQSAFGGSWDQPVVLWGSKGGMEQSKAGEAARKGSLENKSKLVRSQQDLCRNVGIWFATPWPCSFGKENLRLAQGCLSRCHIEVLPRAFFMSEQPPLLLGERRV